jgi:hypothetical protein
MSHLGEVPKAEGVSIPRHHTDTITEIQSTLNANSIRMLEKLKELGLDLPEILEVVEGRGRVS